MKVITFASFKGGCGKTTSVMAITSMLVNHGNRVELIDCDRQRQLSTWQKSAQKNDLWDDYCNVHSAIDLDQLETTFQTVEESEPDYVIIDTAGGASDLNTSIILGSDIIIVPSSPTALDVQSTVDTFRYAHTQLKHNKLDIPIVLLWQRFPSSKLNASHEKYISGLAKLPQFTSKLHVRDAFIAIASDGLMHKRHLHLSEQKLMRLKSIHYGTAVNEAEAVTNEILNAMEEVDVAV